jgi:4-cresol dehydrogenase (hydroxylating) flavoprotein subunit
MTDERLKRAIAAWHERLGAGAVLSADAAQSRYGACTTGVKRDIPAALRPKTVDDVVAIVTIASDHRVPIYPISTGHNWGYGTANPLRSGNVVVDLSALNRIIDMDGGLGLVTLEPGVTQGDLRKYLDEHALPFLVPATGAGPTCSLVGNALERGYGITPYSDHFAAVTSLEAVLPNGTMYRSALSALGGEAVDRAFKWGLGPYIDGLFAQGNLGIVTSMTIALAPIPERIDAFYFWIRDDAALEAAVLAIQSIIRRLGPIVGGINLMNPRRVLAMMVPYPRDATDRGSILPDSVIAEMAKSHGVMAWTGVGALYGTAPVVAAARKVVRESLRSIATRLVFVTPRLARWANRLVSSMPGPARRRFGKMIDAVNASMKLFAGDPSEVALPLAYWKSGSMPPPGAELDPARDGCGLIWYPPLVPMKPERVRAYVKLVDSVCRAHGIEPLVTMTSLSDRCFDSSVPLLFDRARSDELSRARDCYDALLEAGRAEGFLPYRLAVGSMDWATHSGGAFWDIAAQIKKSIDPHGIVAPGRYAP